MIAFRCPKCQMKLRASEEKAGATVACSECGQRLVVPKPAGASSASPKSKALSDSGSGSGIRKRRMQQDDDSSGSGRGSGIRKRRMEQDDDGEEQVRRSRRPVKKSAAPEKPSSAMPLLIGGIAAGVAVLLIGGVVAVVALSGKSDKKKGQVPPGYVEQSAPGPVVQLSVPPPPLPIKPPATPAKAEEELPPTLVTSGNTGQDIYKYTLQSVVWVIGRLKKGVAFGSGTLVDKKNRLVLTNEHVVNGGLEFVIFFPKYANGELVTERGPYAKQFEQNAAIHGHVVGKDTVRDLALIQMDRIPSGVEALGLAQSSAAPGQAVHSLGSPGISGPLWVYTPGTVRGVSTLRWRVVKDPKQQGEEEDTPSRDSDHHARVVVTTSPINHGDSGGPLVNENGELVGVTQGVNPSEQSVSLFIDVTEARDFIQSTCRNRGMWWSASKRSLRSTQMGDLPRIVKALSSEDESVRGRAVQALGIIGPDAKIAIAPLIRVVREDKSDSVRHEAAKALEQIGPPDRGGMRLLVEALHAAGNTDLRVYAAEALGKLGVAARSAVSELLIAARDPELSVRQNAVKALGKIGADDRDPVLRVLQEAMKDPEHDVRVAAAEALTSSNFLSPSSLPMLTEMLKEQDPEAQAIAVRAIAGLGGAAKPALPKLVDLVKSPNVEVRRAAIETLGKQGVEGKFAVAAITSGLSDSESTVRVAACTALGLLGPSAVSASPLLAGLTSDPDKDVRKSAVIALGKVGAKDQNSVSALSRTLKDEDQAMKMEVLNALGQIGPPARSAVPDIIIVLQQEDKELREKVVDTIGKIVKGKKAVSEELPALLAALQGSTPWVRWGAAEAIGQIAPELKGQNALKARILLAALAEADHTVEVREAARQALAKIPLR